MRNQLEGGALQGLSRALGEEVTWDEAKVTSVNWQTYRSLPLGFDVPKADRAHGYAHLRLENSSDEAVSEAGSKLHDLRKRRNRADYDQRAKFNTTDADDAVGEARLIIETLDDAFTEPTRSQITDAIKKYERDVLKEATWRA